MHAGQLKHRITIQAPTGTQNTTTGEVVNSWTTFATAWASVEPLSVREFISAQAEQSKIKVRIVTRYIRGLKARMRVYHTSEDKYYNIEGVLSDKGNGKTYITLACSEIEDA